MQDPRAALEPFAAGADELVRGSLEPRRHHPAVVVPDGAEPLPIAGVAPDRPVLDQLADRLPLTRAVRRIDLDSQSPLSYLNEMLRRTRYSATFPSLIVTSKRVASATRRSRTVRAAVSTALLAAASHESVLTPITSVTRYTLSLMPSSLQRRRPATGHSRSSLP